MGRDHFPNLPIGAGMGFSRGIMLLEDCEGTFTWITGGTGGDEVHEFAAAAAFTGTYGMRLKTRTTGAAAGDYLQAAKRMSFPRSGLLVIRGRITSPDISTTSKIILEIQYSDGTTNHYARLTYTEATPKMEYTNDAGADVEIAAMAVDTLDNQFVEWELVLDLLTNAYISATFNGITADLNGLGLPSTGADAWRYLNLILEVDAIANAPTEIYADNIYVGEYLES